MRRREQNGTIVRALALTAVALAVFAPGASAVPGEPDASFGAGGVAEPLPPNSGSSLSALGFTPGGAIDAIGTYSPSDEYEVLALRLTESGALDPGFGHGGWENAYFVEHVEHSLALETGNAEMVRTDGSIVVGASGVVGRLLPSGAVTQPSRRVQGSNTAHLRRVATARSSLRGKPKTSNTRATATSPPSRRTGRTVNRTRPSRAADIRRSRCSRAMNGLARRWTRSPWKEARRSSPAGPPRSPREAGSRGSPACKQTARWTRASDPAGSSACLSRARRQGSRSRASRAVA